MSRPIVLVVDDQQFICESVAIMLKDAYDVQTFTSGKDAMKYMSDHTADIVLVDYEMPGMTGYEVLLAMRGNKYNSKTPVIFITAETNERMKMEMIARGACDYICKPINSSALHQSIKKHLSG